jgi:hypothetical protein
MINTFCQYHSAATRCAKEVGLPRDTKTPLDYLGERGELVPVQVRLPKELVERVKARLQKHDMTFTELIRGACQWYLEIAEETIVEKKRGSHSQ